MKACSRTDARIITYNLIKSNHFPTFNLPNAYSLGDASRLRNPQLPVSEKYSDVTKWVSTILKVCLAYCLYAWQAATLATRHPPTISPRHSPNIVCICVTLISLFIVCMCVIFISVVNFCICIYMFVCPCVVFLFLVQVSLCLLYLLLIVFMLCLFSYILFVFVFFCVIFFIIVCIHDFSIFISLCIICYRHSC